MDCPENNSASNMESGASDPVNLVPEPAKGVSLKTVKAVWRKVARKWSKRLPDNVAASFKKNTTWVKENAKFVALTVDGHKLTCLPIPPAPRRKAIEAIFREIHAEVNQCLASRGDVKRREVSHQRNEQVANQK
jgi:hypothetical protein